MTAIRGKTVSLVLGSGGARGLAHLGVIHELVGAGCEIKAISGASIGALVGGVFAAGKLSDFETWITSLNRLDIVPLLDLTWKSGGILGGDRVMQSLSDMMGDLAIEDLPVAFTAVAVDITREKEVWINRGPLAKAIRASVALPMILTPVIAGDAVLVDGGVLNPVPIAPTFGDGTDVVIAVNLGGLPVYAGGDKRQEPEPLVPDSFPLSETINQLIEHVAPTRSGTSASNQGILEIANRAFDTMQNGIARQKLAAYPPDHVIEIPRNACGMLEFHRAAEMIELGRKKTREIIEQIARVPGS